MQNKITIADAPNCLNTNDKAMWVLGYQAAVEALKPCLHQIHEPPTKTEALAHYSQQAILAMGEASAAAVAVPDERAAFEKWASFVGYSIKRWQADANLYEEDGTEDAWVAWQHRAALASTPAAAAPVVLPEPVAAESRFTSFSGDRWKWCTVEHAQAFGQDKGYEVRYLYTEQQVRALLAGVSAPAMAVPSEGFKLSVYSALGCGSEAAEFAAVTNIQNLIRRESCLSAVEHKFFMVATPPDEDEGETEPGEECLLNWGQDPEQYAAQFEEALKRIAPLAQADARDAAFEAVRKKFCKLQRYSFFLDDKGNVRRTPDYCGNWVEFETVHTLFEPAAVDAAIAAQAAQQGGDKP